VKPAKRPLPTGRALRPWKSNFVRLLHWDGGRGRRMFGSFLNSSQASEVARRRRYHLCGCAFRSPHTYFDTTGRKLHSLQKLFYRVMYFLIPILVVTGWALLMFHKSRAEIFGESGIGSLLVVHIYTGLAFTVFVVIEIVRADLRATLERPMHKPFSKLTWRNVTGSSQPSQWIQEFQT
jgi:thiosulfate reductase cytochrome b subunit